MTTQQEALIKQAIINQYSDKAESLVEELDRYISTANAKGSNRMSFANLSNELKTLIVKTNSKTQTKQTNSKKDKYNR